MAEQQLRVFVSHSHQDDAYCRIIVQALRDAGADVWYDEHNMGSGQLRDVILRELGSRPIFVLILSKDAIASRWVKREADWAEELIDRDPSRVFLPVTAAAIERTDFGTDNGWLAFYGYKRIEAPGFDAYEVREAANRLLRALALTPAGEAPVPVAPQPAESAADLVTRGSALNAQNKYAEALPLFERATQLAPDSFDAWFNLGYTFELLGRHADALQANERATTLDPNSNAASYNLANALHNLGRYEEALAEYERNFDASDTRDWNGKGNALRSLGRHEEALEAFDQALAINPNDTIGSYNKGLTLNDLKRYEEALDAYEQNFDANDIRDWDSKGNALRSLGRYDEALDAFDHALAIDPDDAIGWYSKGLALELMQRYQEALAAYERGFDPNDARDWNGKARCLRALGRVAEPRRPSDTPRR